MVNLLALVSSLVITTPISYYLLRDKRKQMIKNNIKIMIRELKLYNSLEQYPKVNYSIELGYIIITLDIRGIVDFKRIDDKQSYIKDLFAAEEIEINNNKGVVTLKLYMIELFEEIYSHIELSPYECLLGYSRNGIITANMKITPHILFSGLSNMGKSKLVYYMLKNLRSTDIVVLNGFVEDFKGFNCIVGEKEIQDYLEQLLEDKSIRERATYIVIEEMQTLSTNKKISDLCKELLSVGRHRNLFCVGIIQIATKENCKFKDLFNTRVSLRQIDLSSYTVCLGCNIEEPLKPREFYVYGSEGLQKGRTFTIK